ncbi:MAG: YceI family protein [Pseudomonadota bacterium]
MTPLSSLRTATVASLIATGLAFAGTAAADGHALSEKVSSGNYVMDVTHGYVTFSYNHLGFSNPQLRFRTVDAKMDLNAADPAASSINVTIAANSIDTGVDVFDGHMNSADWLDTETYPEITFVSTALEQTDAGTGTLTGDLTIKGVTKPVTLDVTLVGAGPHPLNQKETVGVEATGTVLRSDFGLGAYAPAVGDEVKILISGEFNKAEAAPEGS